MRRCIVSLATQGRRFPEKLRRLGRSIKRNGFDGEFLSWPPGQLPPGFVPHSQVPFGFKPCCLMDARRRGFDSMLWLDSSCVVIGRLEPLFRDIEEHGYVLFRNGSFRVGEWASDFALDHFALSR